MIDFIERKCGYCKHYDHNEYVFIRRFHGNYSGAYGYCWKKDKINPRSKEACKLFEVKEDDEKD